MGIEGGTPRPPNFRGQNVQETLDRYRGTHGKPGRTIKNALRKCKIHEHRLPPYSPELNACEPLIRWHKEVLSYNWSWDDLEGLGNAFKTFNISLAHRLDEVIRRCKPVVSTSRS